MNLVEDLENLIIIWKERHTYMSIQAREAFDINDMERQSILINNSKQVQNSINDLQTVLGKEKERDKNWNSACNKLENVLNAERMY